MCAASLSATRGSLEASHFLCDQHDRLTVTYFVRARVENLPSDMSLDELKNTAFDFGEAGCDLHPDVS